MIQYENRGRGGGGRRGKVMYGIKLELTQF